MVCIVLRAVALNTEFICNRNIVAQIYDNAIVKLRHSIAMKRLEKFIRSHSLRVFFSRQTKWAIIANLLRFNILQTDFMHHFGKIYLSS